MLVLARSKGICCWAVADRVRRIRRSVSFESFAARAMRIVFPWLSTEFNTFSVASLRWSSSPGGMSGQWRNSRKRRDCPDPESSTFERSRSCLEAGLERYSFTSFVCPFTTAVPRGERPALLLVLSNFWPCEKNHSRNPFRLDSCYLGVLAE